MSSSSTTTGGGWWDAISVYESDYVPGTFTPGSSVEANHELLAGMRENNFDTSDSAYTYGLLTASMVFLVSGILACIFLPLCYLAIGKSRQELLSERLNLGRRIHWKGDLVMFVASLAAIATACGAFWGLGKTDMGLTNIEDGTQSIATDLQTILSLPNDTLGLLKRVTTDYSAFITAFDNCTDFGLFPPSATIADTGVTTLTEDVLEEFDELNSESMSELADDVQGVSDAVADTEGVRKGVVWPTLTLSMIFTVAFVVTAIGTYECIACGASTCDTMSCVVSPCTIFLAIVIWLSAASAVSLSALSGDFCTDPDANVETLIAESSKDQTLQSLLTYYTGDCTSENFAIDAILAAQETAMPTIQETLPVLYWFARECEGLLPSVKAVNASLYDLWLVLEEAAQLSSCENLNGPYQAAVYYELCAELPKGLLGFWVSCVILTLLLVVLAVQWNRLIRRQLTEEEAQIAEERARTKPVWIPERFSRRNLYLRSSSELRRSLADKRRVRPATIPPNESGGADVRAPASGSNITDVQRPVEIADPACQARWGLAGGDDEG